MDKKILLLLPVALLLLLPACRKDQLFTDDPGARLEFSQDTILFDTIFTQPIEGGYVPSVVKRFVARNRENRAVRVDIALAGGQPSPYRINVDGLSGTAFQGVEILGGDSVFVFVEATLDQSNTNNPLIVEDEIIFNTNGNEQLVKLQAWGQDAYYHMIGPDSIQRPNLPRYGIVAGGTDENGNTICETVVWPSDKPHVIYGYAVVDSCSTLIIQPGARVHVHGGGGLWIYRHGRIQANGTVDQPITFQGDRLEPFYAELPGQWDRIWINEGATNADNEFTNVTIKNALIGLQLETWPLLPELGTSANTVKLTNVNIRNCSAAGILSRNYRIRSTNLLIGECGQHAMALTGGGEYFFNHTTIANYWSYGIRQTPAFIMTNTFQAYTGEIHVRDIENSQFVNGIIFGSNGNEFQLALEGGTALDFTFDRYIIRSDQPNSDPTHFTNEIYWNNAPGFANVTERNFRLLEGAFARDRAIVLPGEFEALEDIEGRQRNCAGAGPDLGAYEFCPG